MPSYEDTITEEDASRAAQILAEEHWWAPLAPWRRSQAAKTLREWRKKRKRSRR